MEKIIKYNSKTYLFISLVAFLILLILSGATHPRETIRLKLPLQTADSSKDVLQKSLDSLYVEMNKYIGYRFRKMELTDSLVLYKKSKDFFSDSLTSQNEFNLSSICEGIKEKNDERLVREKLRKIFTSIFYLENEIFSLVKHIKSVEEEEKKIDEAIATLKNKFESDRKYLNDLAENISGPGKLIINKVPYRFYIASPQSDRVQIFTNPFKGKGQTFKDVISRATKTGIDPLMLTNAGMYTMTFAPQGLLVENGKVLTKLDTLTNIKDKNFYMQPNGVFLVDSNGFNILSTENFRSKYTDKANGVLFATQSGPMIINKGVKNRNFRKNSNNFYIRSGVGMMSKGKIIFIISDQEINFFEFSTVFEDVFGCKNALFLDGAISQMFINPETSGFKNTMPTDHGFGPVILVTKAK